MSYIFIQEYMGISGEGEQTDRGIPFLFMDYTPLPAKYQKALKLIGEHELSYRKIAKMCGIGEDTLYELVEGKVEKHGNIGRKFYEELRATEKRRDKEIRVLVNSNKIITFRLINDYLKQVSQEKNLDRYIGMLVTIANCLAKYYPRVEIESVTYKKGLSPEDIFLEFQRLTAIAFERGKGQFPEQENNGL